MFSLVTFFSVLETFSTFSSFHPCSHVLPAPFVLCLLFYPQKEGIQLLIHDQCTLFCCSPISFFTWHYKKSKWRNRKILFYNLFRCKFQLHRNRVLVIELVSENYPTFSIIFIISFSCLSLSCLQDMIPCCNCYFATHLSSSFSFWEVKLPIIGLLEKKERDMIEIVEGGESKRKGSLRNVLWSNYWLLVSFLETKGGILKIPIHSWLNTQRIPSHKKSVFAFPLISVRDVTSLIFLFRFSSSSNSSLLKLWVRRKEIDVPMSKICYRHKEHYVQWEGEKRKSSTSVRLKRRGEKGKVPERIHARSEAGRHNPPPMRLADWLFFPVVTLTHVSVSLCLLVSVCMLETSFLDGCILMTWRWFVGQLFSITPGRKEGDEQTTTFALGMYSSLLPSLVIFSLHNAIFLTSWMNQMEMREGGRGDEGWPQEDTPAEWESPLRRVVMVMMNLRNMPLREEDF